MCGIFAYKGNGNTIEFLLNGLKNLEYRGYDSAGISVFNEDGEVYLKKSVGRVSKLVGSVLKDTIDASSFNIGIAHTRWATHGGVTVNNTHPHYSNNKRFYLVHNGIIENYIELKKDLEKKGYTFYSDTDTEVVANLIEYLFEDTIENTIEKVKDVITGAYSIAIIDINEPNKIIALKLGSPLVLGIGDDGLFLSSDSNAISNITKKYIPIDDNEVVIINDNDYKILSYGKEIKKESYDSFISDSINEIGDFKHFMLKEIFEIPTIIENVLGGRINFNTYEIFSNSLNKLDIKSIEKIEIIASGTSYNAGFIGTYLFEELANIPSQINISTEFKYKKQFINDKTLYIFISQSGETADSLECLKMVKNRGGKTFGIVNVVGSSIARICGHGLYTHCGVEIGVAATKTFVGQLLTLLVIALFLGNKKNLDYTNYKDIIDGLAHLKDNIYEVLNNSKNIQEIANKFSNFTNMFFLGRNMFYPVAMEGSLKCKEITYNHTESYTAGELKHGPLSLIDKNFPCIILNPKTKLLEKNLSTLKEIQARSGEVIGIISKGDIHKNEYNYTIELPKTNKYNALFTSSVSLQLFSYYIALKLGREIDKPRNLAKSVTVE